MFLKIIGLFLVVSSVVHCEIQLPNTTKPLSYYLSLTTYIHEEDYSFFGFVDINIRSLETTDTVTLHAENLDDLEVTLRDKNSSPAKVYHNLTFSEDKENDFLRIEMPDNVVLQEGHDYTISVSFLGEMANSSYGFYKLNFMDSQNRRVVLAATQFENIFARRVFPCYDDPKYKANFTIALTHGSEFKAYSNMPQEGPSVPNENGNLVTTTFRETPKLPVYTIAFMLAKGYREYEIQGTGSSIQQRIIAQNVKDPKNIRFYSDFVDEIFHNFEKYFGKLDYLPKLDHVSIPATASGGMENWGLVIYNALYFELTKEDQPSIKLNIRSTMAHEIGHMWFGNTITVKNWRDIWITESLTTFYGWKVYENTKPGRDVFNYSIKHINDFVFTNPTTLSLSRYVDSKNLSNLNMYDYYKGCSMFRMIENVLTKNTMDKAMRNLIQKYQYSNFDEDDLLAEFQSAATEDNIQLFEHQGSIDRVFKSWFHKPNYPIVTVTRSYETGDLTISQRSSQKNETHLWDIPLNFATSKEPNFEETTAEYILPKVPILTIRANGKFMLDQNEWIIMNKQQTGLYVVNYDQHNWEVIAEALAYSHESIHYLNRAQIVRDVMVLHANNYLSLEIAFDVLSYLSQETDLTVWRSAINTLMYFNTVLEDGKAEEKFKEFVREIIKEIVENVKIQDSDPEEKAFISDTRISLLELACEVDHPGCLLWAKRQFQSYLNNHLNFDYSAFNLIVFNGPKVLDDVDFQRARDKLFRSKNAIHYIGLLQNSNSLNIQNLLNETLSKDDKFITAAFHMGLLKADFKDIADVFMKLPKSNQDYILNKLFSIMEKDNFEYDVIYSDSYSIENAKKMFNDKLFVLFQISEEKLSSVPNYRLNPEFADNDNSAFEWLSEYEMSFIYPTEDTPDITTPIYTPDEEESTFSAIFVDYDDKTETNILETTISEDLENDVEIFTTTESPDEDYSEEDEEGQQEEEEEVEEFLPSGADDVDEEENDNELNLPNLVEEKIRTISSLSNGLLFRSFSFITFMVVPFVIVL